MVYFSVKNTRVKLMKYLFWLSWITLSLLIINEKTESFKVSEYITYFTVSVTHIQPQVLQMIDIKLPVTFFFFSI